LFVTVIGGVASTNLTPASRRQDHTSSPSASALFVSNADRVHRIPFRVRDVRNAPHVGQDGAICTPDLCSEKQKYFCNWGWTGKSPAPH
jgi:hypothetical protein